MVQQANRANRIVDDICQSITRPSRTSTRSVAKVNHVDKALYQDKDLEVQANNRRTVYIKGKNNENQTNEVRQGGTLTS
jgi:hypothetical protein